MGDSDKMIDGLFLGLVSGQKFAISATTAKNSTALTKNKVGVWASVDCYIAFGGSGVTATTSSIPIPAGTWLFLQNPDGYIAAICDSGVTGYLNIIECI